MLTVVKIDAIQLDNEFSNSLLEGVLEVPSNKEVDDLSVSHFKKLIDKKGREPIIRALTNLQNWFKYKKPSLSRWAVSMKKSIGNYGAKEK